MGIAELLDTHFKPHGKWEGMSLGWTTGVWLAHNLTEGEQRMSQVQAWAGLDCTPYSTVQGRA